MLFAIFIFVVVGLRGNDRKLSFIRHFIGQVKKRKYIKQPQYRPVLKVVLFSVF